MVKALITAALVSACLCVAACRTADMSGYVEKSAVEKEMATLNGEFEESRAL